MIGYMKTDNIGSIDLKWDCCTRNHYHFAHNLLQFMPGNIESVVEVSEGQSL